MKLVVVLSLVLLASSTYGSITYQYYSRLNPKNGQPLTYKNFNSISKSNFNVAKMNKVIIHGYGQNGRSDYNRDMKDALLNIDDYNVIVVDWSTAAGSSYKEAVKNTKAIGQSVAQFIDWLELDKGYIHILGFDLGAHIAGFAGKHTTKGRVDKITGLDPNRSGFNPNSSANRLAAGDARFVEVAHSNGGKIGMMDHIVNSDIYINDGKTQPGCSTDECSHYFAAKAYIAWMRGGLYNVYTCESLAELDAQGCGYRESEWGYENTGIVQMLVPEPL